MKEAKDLLQDFLLSKPELNRRIEEETLDVYRLWSQTLCTLGLEALAQNSEVVDFERLHLRIVVRHPVFLQELKLQQGAWQPALEEALRHSQPGIGSIRKVSFRVRG